MPDFDVEGLSFVPPSNVRKMRTATSPSSALDSVEVFTPNDIVIQLQTYPLAILVDELGREMSLFSPDVPMPMGITHRPLAEIVKQLPPLLLAYDVTLASKESRFGLAAEVAIAGAGGVILEDLHGGARRYLSRTTLLGTMSPNEFARTSGGGHDYLALGGLTKYKCNYCSETGYTTFGGGAPMCRRGHGPMNPVA